MGRVFPSATQVTTQPIQSTGGRIFGAPDNPRVEPYQGKDWESLSFGQKAVETLKEVPRTLYNFIPPSIRQEFEKPVAEQRPFPAVAKGAVEFGLGIAEVTKQAIGGGLLTAKKTFTGGREDYVIPGFKKAGGFVGRIAGPHIAEQITQLGEVSSWGVQKKQMEEQGFSSEEASALVGINVYLGAVPFVAKGLRTPTGRRMAGRVFTKEVPFAETPAGIKAATKEAPTTPEKMVRVERPTITGIKRIFGKTKEQQDFNTILEDHLERYFEGRQALLGKEDPLNQALVKLTDEELHTYSGITQGLTTLEKPSVNLKKAVDFWREINKAEETDLIARGKLTSEQVENRRWKPVETITGRSREELKAMGIDPIYYPYLAEDLLKKSDFIATTGKRTKGGYLKRFTGKMLAEDSYIKNPKVAIPRHRVQVFRDKMNAELVESIRDTFGEQDKIIIEKYKGDPAFAEAMGVEEWKPAGSLRFYRQIVTEVAPSKRLPQIKKNVIGADKVSDLREQIKLYKESLREHPGARLEKYGINKGKGMIGELPEVTGEKKHGLFLQRGDDIVTELGFADLAEAEISYQSYRKGRMFLGELKTELAKAKQDTFTDYSPADLNRINELLAGTNEIITRTRAFVGVSKKVESYWIPKDVAKELNRFSKPGAVEKTLRMTYDPLIDVWRVSVLSLVPRWLYNNTIGNTMLSILGKTDPFAFFKATKERFARTKLGERIGIRQREIPKGVFVKEYAGGELPKTGQLGSLPKEQTQFLRPIENWLNLLEQAKNYRALRLPAVATQKLIRGWVALGKPIGHLNKVVENWFRGAMYISKTEGKFLGFQLDKPAPPVEGLRHVNEFLFDYTKLTRTERATFRRALPFYNWMKNITEFSFKFPVKHPMRGLIVGALLQDYVDYINEVNQAEDKTKSILRIKTDMTYEGRPLYWNVKSAIPFSDVFNTIPIMPEQWRRLFTANPIVRIIAEQAFKINAFTGQPFTQPKAFQEFDTFGKPILPVPSLPAHIGKQFPQVKMGQEIIDTLRHGKVIRRYELGQPKIVRGQIQTESWLFPILRYFGISISPIEINKIKQQTERKGRHQEVQQRRFERQIESGLEKLKQP